RRPAIAEHDVAKVVRPVPEGSATAFVNPRHHDPREVLRAAVVARARVQRLREPPPPRLERRPPIAVEPAIALRQLPLEEGGEITPTATLVGGHVGERDGEGAVGGGEVARDVPHQARQCFTPPGYRAAPLGDY